MKPSKILFEKYKARFPNCPPDEIDFGLGFRAALDMVIIEATLSPVGFRNYSEELGNETKKD